MYVAGKIRVYVQYNNAGKPYYVLQASEFVFGPRGGVGTGENIFNYGSKESVGGGG